MSALSPTLSSHSPNLVVTDALIVSFDAINATLPGPGLSCAQGLPNLAHVGPKDGCLLLKISSSALFEEYFGENRIRPRLSSDAKHYDLYLFQQDALEWFKKRGCKEIKVETEPGNLALWDWRTIHHVTHIESE